MTVRQLEKRVGVALSVGGYDLIDSLEAFWVERRITIQGEGRQLNEMGYYIGRKNDRD
jgi:hypothetical protein